VIKGQWANLPSSPDKNNGLGYNNPTGVSKFKLLAEEAFSFFATSGNIACKSLIILGGIGFIILMAYLRCTHYSVEKPFVK
jgi:hypothetical protein